MELKNYQLNTLEVLRQYFEACSTLKDAGYSFTS